VSRPAPAAEAVRRGERRALAKAITLLESSRADDAAAGRALLEELMPHTGGSRRVGITGPPGVGKSSFIETLGLQLLARGERVAVLAIDPSSPVTGGSILGDKTRMERLAQDERAFIRPSPSGSAPGGVAHRTREALLLCEAAGFGVVLVETVGIGQSEVAVRSMVDCFLVLLQPGAGDDLQGIKKGVLELADLLVVNKADGELRAEAERTRSAYAGALQLLRPASPSWRPRVELASARSGEGIEGVWRRVEEHAQKLAASGEWAERRRSQARDWLWSLLQEGLLQAFRQHPRIEALLPELERQVSAQERSASAAARSLLEAFQKG